MDTKTLRTSNRGLTFSFPSSGKLCIGAKFDYVVDAEKKVISIIPSENGKHTVSRKRTGTDWKSLIDLRGKDVLKTLGKMSRLRIQFLDNAVVVSEEKGKGKVIAFTKPLLAHLRAAAGMEEQDACKNLFAGAQISFDEYLSGLSAPFSIPTISSNLADVFTVVSLFSGAGILDWPFFTDDRFRIKYAIDYEEAACETYRKNIGNHIVCGDIHRAFTDNGYMEDRGIKAPDIIIGGPSCKPFSNANRHTRLADHPDSDLVVEYMRIVKTLQPKVFAMENVPAILTACDGAYFSAIKEAAADCGYDIAAQVVKDCDVGGYTTRKRAIILGSRIGKAGFSTVLLRKGKKTVRDALSRIATGWSNLHDVTMPSVETRRRMAFVPQGGNYESIPPEWRTASRNRHSCTYRRLSMDEPSPTIVNWRKPPLIHPTENRTLSVAEAKALQGLPGDYEICGTLGQKQQQVGNAVPVALGRFIKEQLLHLLSPIRSMRTQPV